MEGVPKGQGGESPIIYRTNMQGFEAITYV